MASSAAASGLTHSSSSSHVREEIKRLLPTLSSLLDALWENDTIGEFGRSCLGAMVGGDLTKELSAVADCVQEQRARLGGVLA